MLFGGEDFDAGIEAIKAKLLIHAIKSSPGGYKLSFEVTLWLAKNFEDAYLPGEAQAMSELLHEALKIYENREHDWRARERQGDFYLTKPVKPSVWRKIQRLLLSALNARPTSHRAKRTKNPR